MATIAQSASRQFEIRYPAALGAIAFGLTLWRGEAVFNYAAKQNWHLDQLYTAVFTISTVVAAFLFTFYTFVLTAERGFIAAARKTPPFERLVSFTMRATWEAAALALLSIPLLVVQPSVTNDSPWLEFIAVWAGLTLWAGAAFVRATWLFSIFAGK